LPTKPRKIKLPKISTERQAIFDQHAFTPENSKSLHEQVEMHFNKALKLYNVPETNNHDRQ